MNLYGLTSEQVAAIQQAIDATRGQAGVLNTPSRPSTDRSWSEAQDYQPPETYVAKPQTVEGIPKLVEAGTGTGTDVSGGDYDEPGVATCDIYKIVEGDDGPELHLVNLSKKVYNISTSDLGQGWMVVTRTKFGKWLVIGTAECEQSIVMFELLEDLTQWSNVTVDAARKTWDPDANEGDGGYTIDCDDVIQVGDLNQVGYVAGEGASGVAVVHLNSRGEEIGTIIDLCCPGEEIGNCLWGTGSSTGG